MSEFKQRAKEIFWSYACNHFFLDRDGANGEYQKLGPTEKDEIEWRSEFIAEWEGRLSVEDLEPLSRLRSAWAVEALPRIIELAELGDSYAKLSYANALWHFGESEALAHSLRAKSREVACRIWKNLAEGAPQLSSAHRAAIDQTAMLAFGAKCPEEYIRNYAKRQLVAHGT